MGTANYIFQISRYDTERLLPQVSGALEKRTELLSRQQYPRIWKYTDKLHSMAQGRTRSRLRTRLMSLLLLAAGIVLLVPGLMEPQKLFVPLLAGAVAAGMGIVGLWPRRRHRKNPFDQSAKLLLAGKDSISAEQAILVSFSEAGMELPTNDGNPELIPYDDFECAIETVDVILFVYGGRVTVLQKKDLTTGEIGAFCQLISDNVKQYQSSGGQS